MASSVVFNGCGRVHSPVELNSTKSVEPKKLSLDRELIESAIYVLPETRKMEEILDNFYNPIHRDENLPLFSKFFTQIIERNPSVFNGLESSQKAQILFDKYRELSLEMLTKKDEFQEAKQAIFDRIKALQEDPIILRTIVEETVDQNCKIRVHQFHRLFILFAAAEALSVSQDSIYLSSAYSFRCIDLSKISLPF